ncbi:hypothetical protein D3C80_2134000 [compost metagenome]
MLSFGGDAVPILLATGTPLGSSLTKKVEPPVNGPTVFGSLEKIALPVIDPEINTF